jgi:hypothetical protein
MNTTPSSRIMILSSWYGTDTLTFEHHPFILHGLGLHSLLQVVLVLWVCHSFHRVVSCSVLPLVTTHSMLQMVVMVAF